MNTDAEYEDTTALQQNSNDSIFYCDESLSK